MKAFPSAAIGLCIALLLSLSAPAIGAGQTPTEDAPVRGGVAALAAAASVAPAPDRSRAIVEIVRAVYSWPQTGPYSNEPTRRRMTAFFADASSQSAAESVPVPLSTAVWSQVLRRPITPDGLVGAILTDRAAALVCYGLAGMDDETLQFFSEHAPLVARLAERSPAPFAAFGESLTVHGGRVVPRGGAAAGAAWEAAVGEKLDRPERFVQSLFEDDRGRLAYLYDVMAHVDASAHAQAFASRPGQDPGASFKRLAALARRAFPEWDITTAPFVRPQYDLAAFFARLRNASAAPPPGSTSLWQRVLGDSSPLDAGGAARLAAETPADAVALAELVEDHPARERERRIDVLTFALRVFAGQAVDDPDAVVAARGFGTFPVLMLTLERIGVRTPALYAAAVRHAERLAALDAGRGHVALAQFQGSLALLARLAAVRTIDMAASERLLRALIAVKLNDDGRYDGAIAAWISNELLPALPSGATRDDAILAAAAGPQSAPATPQSPRVEWEGQRYLVDPGGAELRRLMRARVRQETASFETVLGLAAAAQTLTRQTIRLDEVQNEAAKLTAAATEIAAAERAADATLVRQLREAGRTLAAVRRAADVTDARRVGTQIVPLVDEMLGAALLSLAYALDLGDPEGTILIAGDPSRRHDFGYNLPGRDARIRSMWSIATIETRNGPWHLVGSALGLDLAMAQLSLRRISVDRVPESPMLNLMQRDGFAATVAVMNVRALTDTDRDAIADHVSRGAARVQALAAGREPADAVVAAIDLDGWRARALRWAITHEPDRVASLLSMVELLVLGGGSPASFNAWGVYALRTAGCLCARLPATTEWRHWWGLSQSGLPATLVADLPLGVAVVLHNLQLPAVMAKSVLAAAMQDFVDGINPTDGNDWLTLARAAQSVGRERYEDYIAASTADGPLVPDAEGRR